MAQSNPRCTLRSPNLFHSVSVARWCARICVWNMANSSADSKEISLPAMYATDAMPRSAKCLITISMAVFSSTLTMDVRNEHWRPPTCTIGSVEA